jgi:hypothetical protein
MAISNGGADFINEVKATKFQLYLDALGILFLDSTLFVTHTLCVRQVF